MTSKWNPFASGTCFGYCLVAQLIASAPAGAGQHVSDRHPPVELEQVLEQIEERARFVLPEGSYKIELAVRSWAPTEAEQEAAIEHVERLIRRAIVTQGAEENRLHQFWINTVAGRGQTPGATRSALGAAGRGDSTSTSLLEWESEKDWYHEKRVFNRGSGEEGLLLVWALNGEGFWRRMTDGRWILEARPDPPSYHSHVSLLRDVLGSVRWLCAHARLHRSSQVAEERSTSDRVRPHGFSVEVREFSDISTPHIRSEGLDMPPGWQEVAGRARVTLDRLRDGERLRLLWIDLDGYPVEEWTLWTLGEARLPSLLRRQLYQLAGGRCLIEYELRFQPLGPLEKSPADFVPPIGSSVEDRRFPAPIFYRIAQDGTLPQSRALERRSRSLAAEILDIFSGPPEHGRVRSGSAAAAEPGRSSASLRTPALIVGLCGVALLGLHIRRMRRRTIADRALEEGSA